MARWTYRQGGTSVTLSSDLERRFADLSRSLASTFVGEMEKSADAITEAARAKWPVGHRKPGTRAATRPHSRDLLYSAIEGSSGGTIAATVASPAPYTLYIKTSQGVAAGPSGRIGADTVEAWEAAGKASTISPWQEYIRKPSKQVARDLGSALAVALAGKWRGSR